MLSCALICVRAGSPGTFRGFRARKVFHTSAAASFPEIRLHAALFSQKTGGLIDTEGLIDIVVAHKNLQSIFLWLEMRRTQAQKVRSSWRERQLVFFGRTLERFRRVLNSINDLVAFPDRYQANDLVQAARGIIPERPFETHALTD